MITVQLPALPTFGLGGRLPRDQINRIADNINLVYADDPDGAVYLMRGFTADDRALIYEALRSMGGEAAAVDAFRRRVEGDAAESSWPLWGIVLIGVAIGVTGLVIYSRFKK